MMTVLQRTPCKKPGPPGFLLSVSASKPTFCVSQLPFSVSGQVAMHGGLCTRSKAIIKPAFHKSLPFSDLVSG